jgi:hypothetical protein
MAAYLRALGASSVRMTAYIQNPRLLQVLQNPRGARLLFGRPVQVNIIRQIRIGNVTEAIVEIVIGL